MRRAAVLFAAMLLAGPAIARPTPVFRGIPTATLIAAAKASPLSPKHGRPGEAYAFRDVFDSVDGLDYERDRNVFAAQWRDRFKDAPPPACENQ